MKFRSADKELLDESVIAPDELYQNLFELDIINQRLGGYAASIKGLESALRAKKNINTVLDIGFGGGDSIKQFASYSAEKNLTMFFYGVDLKKDCVNYATRNLAAVTNKYLICDDYRNIAAEMLKNVDLIHCSLFLHHLTDDEIVELLKFSKANNCIFLANDLHRNWWAYYSIKLLTFLFSRSYLVKNDAPLSVKRGFRREELIALLERAGYRNYSVKWSWAFRFIVIAYD